MSKELEVLERMGKVVIGKNILFSDTFEYVNIKTYILKSQQKAKELEELKQTNDKIKENVEGILSRMITFDEVSDLTLSYVEDIQDEIDKLVGGYDE